jgi:hypothetical protein
MGAPSLPGIPQVGNSWHGCLLQHTPRDAPLPFHYLWICPVPAQVISKVIMDRIGQPLGMDLALVRPHCNISRSSPNRPHGH